MIDRSCIDNDGAQAKVWEYVKLSFMKQPWVTKATIPSSVTSISDYAFSGRSLLKSVTIPSSVTSIGDCAFQDCTVLKDVTIPNSVTSIGEAAFAGCRSLTGVTIPPLVTSIGQETFAECRSLTSVTILPSVTSIDAYVFAECGSLKSVMIPKSVTSIGGGAFYGCSDLKDVYYSGTQSEWKKIEVDSLNSWLQEATIHYGVTNFAHCTVALLIFNPGRIVCCPQRRPLAVMPPAEPLSAASSASWEPVQG